MLIRTIIILYAIIFLSGRPNLYFHILPRNVEWMLLHAHPTDRIYTNISFLRTSTIVLFYYTANVEIYIYIYIYIYIFMLIRSVSFMQAYYFPDVNNYAFMLVRRRLFMGAYFYPVM